MTPPPQQPPHHHLHPLSLCFPFCYYFSPHLTLLLHTHFIFSPPKCSPSSIVFHFRVSLHVSSTIFWSHIPWFFFLTPPKKPQHCQPYHHFPSHTDLIYQILWFSSRHHLAAFIDSFHYWVLVRVKYLKSVSVLTTPTVSWRCLLGFVAMETNGRNGRWVKMCFFFFFFCYRKLPWNWPEVSAAFYFKCLHVNSLMQKKNHSCLSAHHCSLLFFSFLHHQSVCPIERFWPTLTL